MPHGSPPEPLPCSCGFYRESIRSISVASQAKRAAMLRHRQPLSADMQITTLAVRQTSLFSRKPHYGEEETCGQPFRRGLETRAERTLSAGSEDPRRTYACRTWLAYKIETSIPAVLDSGSNRHYQKGDTTFFPRRIPVFLTRVRKDCRKFLESHGQHGRLGCFLRESAPREQRLLIRPPSDNPAPPQGLPPCLAATTSTRS